MTWKDVVTIEIYDANNVSKEHDDKAIKLETESCSLKSLQLKLLSSL